MPQRLALMWITLVGLIVALPKVPAFAVEVAQAAPTPTPPLFIPAWVLGGGHFYRGQGSMMPPTPRYNDVDPGAAADQALFAGVLDADTVADATLGTNCPGIDSGGSNVSKCNPYLYINMLDLICGNALLSQSAYAAMNTSTNESAFVH